MRFHLEFHVAEVFTPAAAAARGYTQQRGMLRLEVVFNDDLTVGISSEIKDEICSKLESAVQALKSRISRICGINELERRTRRTRI